MCYFFGSDEFSSSPVSANMNSIKFHPNKWMKQDVPITARKQYRSINSRFDNPTKSPLVSQAIFSSSVPHRLPQLSLTKASLSFLNSKLTTSIVPKAKQTMDHANSSHQIFSNSQQIDLLSQQSHQTFVSVSMPNKNGVIGKETSKKENLQMYPKQGVNIVTQIRQINKRRLESNDHNMIPDSIKQSYQTNLPIFNFAATINTRSDGGTNNDNNNNLVFFSNDQSNNTQIVSINGTLTSRPTELNYVNEDTIEQSAENIFRPDKPVALTQSIDSLNTSKRILRIKKADSVTDLMKEYVQHHESTSPKESSTTLSTKNIVNFYKEEEDNHKPYQFNDLTKMENSPEKYSTLNHYSSLVVPERRKIEKNRKNASSALVSKVSSHFATLQNLIIYIDKYFDIENLF